MRNHDTPASGVRISCSLERFRDCSDLIDFEEQGVTCFLVDGFLDAKRIGDGKIVADNLTVVFGAERSPSVPVILLEGIFDTVVNQFQARST